jgi:hypothetical protein
MALVMLVLTVGIAIKFAQVENDRTDERLANAAHMAGHRSADAIQSEVSSLEEQVQRGHRLLSSSPLLTQISLGRHRAVSSRRNRSGGRSEILSMGSPSRACCRRGRPTRLALMHGAVFTKKDTRA